MLTKLYHSFPKILERGWHLDAMGLGTHRQRWKAVLSLHANSGLLPSIRVYALIWGQGTHDDQARSHHFRLRRRIDR
jgi:hypothetical protein